ncbi:MAG: low temperature requirement protein A, partial [Chloroflexota bacterium]
VDDFVHRSLIFIQMFGVAVMGLSVSNAFGDLAAQFALGNVITRLMLVLMYLRAARVHPESATMSQYYAAGFSIGTLIWSGSLLLDEFQWLAWLIAIVCEFFVLLMPGMRQSQRQWPVDTHHITERFGIFTIILLGESFVKILDDAQGTRVGPEQLVFSVGGLLVLYSLWWLYFSDTAEKPIGYAKGWHPIAWLYGHLPLAAGLVAFGVGAKKLYAETFEFTGEALTPKYRLLYTAALVLYLLALALIDLGIDDEETYAKQNREALVHLICAVVIGIIGITMTGLNAIAFVIIMAVVMVGQVAYSIYLSQQEEQTARHNKAEEVQEA